MDAEWTTIRLRVTTPVFNAGAETDSEADIRVPSLRGAMRFWFRALAGQHTGANLSKLSYLEEKVFGSAADPSPLILRIPTAIPVHRREKMHDFLPKTGARNTNDHPGRWIVYLLGQGLANIDFTLNRAYVDPGTEFDLRLRFHHRRADDPPNRAAIERLAFASLWATCAYGGIGARVRRGFGGLRILNSDRAPDPWIPDDLRGPGLDQYDNADPTAARPLASVRADLATLASAYRGTTDGTGQPPPFPTLAHPWFLGGLAQAEHTSWDAALAYAGEQLRHFRASQPNPGADYQPELKTPEWVQVVRGNKTHFPLGALGLPVIYKDGYSVQAMDGNQKGRRASALWLRAVGENQTWKIFSFAFLGAYLPGPDAPTVQRLGPAPTKPLTVTDAEVENVCRQWIDAHRNGHSFLDQTRT